MDDHRIRELEKRSRRIRKEDTSKLRTEKGGSRPGAVPVDSQVQVEIISAHKVHGDPTDNTQAFEGENMVEDLMHQWILAPKEEKLTAPHEDATNTITKCHKRFRRGERMYACPRCGYDDRTVFCPDCFNTTDHQGHGVETIVAREDGEAYCDCGHVGAVKRRMTCAKHGAMIPER